jgi:hypothetical protein
MPPHLALRRLRNQHLVSSSLDAATDVVRALGAVQSQDYANAKWAIARRVLHGMRHADVEQAFATGAILRTHVLRPTWHFVLREDARWLLGFSAPRVSAAMRYYNRVLEFDRALFRRSNAALEHALRDGKQLTRAELAQVLHRARVDVSTGQRVGHLLMQAELDRVIISGARRGKQFTYALFDERVPPGPERDRDEALADLSLRYFRTRGPATLHDFSWWSGLTIADARRALEINGRHIARAVIDGREYWIAADAPPPPSRAPRVAHLLPNYDELFVGFRDRLAFAERLRATAPRARVDALLGHMLFIDGQIVGGWRRTLGTHVEVEVRLPRPISRTEQTLVASEIERFATFLGVPARVRYRRGTIALTAATPPD